MENKNSKKYQDNISGVIIAIIIFFSIIYYLKFKQDALETSNTYTIATVSRITETIIYYKFDFRGKLFNGSTGLPSNIEIQKNGRYLLKILKDKLWLSELQFNILVPKCIKEAPSDGWDGIPDFIKMCE